MTLISKDKPEPEQITCMCGTVHRNYAQYYAHVGECPIDRCAHCLEVVNLNVGLGFDEHECAAIKLMRLQYEVDF